MGKTTRIAWWLGRHSSLRPQYLRPAEFAVRALQESRLASAPATLAPNPLPLFLRERYTLRRAEIFGRDFLLALDSLAEEAPSAATYADFAELLASHLGKPPVLVLPALATHIRQGLIRLGRPFIVPGSQTFLPTALIDLRERQPAPRLQVPKSLSPAAQSV
jgi:hypothetical protein